MTLTTRIIEITTKSGKTNAFLHRRGSVRIDDVVPYVLRLQSAMHWEFATLRPRKTWHIKEKLGNLTREFTPSNVLISFNR